MAYEAYVDENGNPKVGKSNGTAGAAKKSAQDRARDLISNGYQGGNILSGSVDEQQGQLAGLNIAALGYGQGLEDTGKDISRVRDLLKNRTDQSGADPVTAAIMAGKAGTVANAQRGMAQSGVKGGAAAGAVSGIERAANQDIAASLYGQQRQSIADERSLASNTLAGTTSLMQGERAASTQAPGAPKASSWTDSVICTELHRQGILSTDLYNKDAEYGMFLKREYPEVVTGYHFLAKPIVKLMQKSKLFTKLISYPALKWARYIAGEENSIIGYVSFNLGQPLCAVIGKVIHLGDKYARKAN
jgi:hypothetical protein